MIKLNGSEKAFLGGLVAFLSAQIVQMQQSGQFNWHQLLWSVGAWVLTHFTVYSATNSADALPFDPQPVVDPAQAPEPQQ